MRRRRWATALLVLAATVGLTASCGGLGPPVAVPTERPPSSPAGLPRPDHVVVVIMENHNLDQVVGNPDAPYLNQLISEGALFTQASAITHPSQPNYLALFSGDTQGVTGDGCPNSFDTPNLARQLLDAHFDFTLYAEDLPAAGDPVCSRDQYARKHNPVPDFTNLPARLAGRRSRTPALRGDAAGASPGWGKEVPVQLPTVVVAGPVQEILLPRSVKQGTALLEFAQVRGEPLHPLEQATKRGGDHGGYLLGDQAKTATPASVRAEVADREWRKRPLAGISCQRVARRGGGRRRPRAPL